MATFIQEIADYASSFFCFSELFYNSLKLLVFSWLLCNFSITTILLAVIINEEHMRIEIASIHVFFSDWWENIENQKLEPCLGHVEKATISVYENDTLAYRLSFFCGERNRDTYDAIDKYFPGERLTHPFMEMESYWWEAELYELINNLVHSDPDKRQIQNTILFRPLLESIGIFSLKMIKNDILASPIVTIYTFVDRYGKEHDATICDVNSSSKCWISEVLKEIVTHLPYEVEIKSTLRSIWDFKFASERLACDNQEFTKENVSKLLKDEPMKQFLL